ncbi:hypothetical protein R3W88_033900 [Solanum pinnatisectum]|uniref:Uncharacterized protein n=1 Tax=Solanum pinnatisectum TaxID=50273 RepID=A0AAV9K001_9SOLN|nr:hypothetical protein R3W88_033900 [Solanum pinnatisectum]
MSEDLTLETPQPPLKKSLSIGACQNLGSPYVSDMSNLGFDRITQLCLYPHIAPLGRILPLLAFSPIVSDALVSLSPPGYDLDNLGLSRCENFPLLSVSPVMPEPSTSLSLCVSNMNIFGLSRLPQLSLYPSSAPLREILILSSSAPVMSDQSTNLSLSLPRFRSTKYLNQVN